MNSRVYHILPLLRCTSRLHHPHRVVPIRHLGRWWSDPFAEMQRAVQQVEQNMKRMDQEMSRVFHELDRVSPVRLSQLPLFGRHRNVPVETSDKEMYRLEVSLPDFAPEDVKITVRDHLLSIHAKKETKGSDGSHYVREYHHEYTLPKEVDPESVRSLLEADGTLKIEAPLQAIESPKPKEIPIVKESGKSSSSDSNAK